MSKRSGNKRQYHSPASLLAAYGERGRAGTVSGVGRTVAPPYTLLDEAYTTRRTPASDAAVSTVSVPCTLTRSDASGSRNERGTAPSAPKWKTVSQPATARRTVSRSTTDPRTKSA